MPLTTARQLCVLCASANYNALTDCLIVVKIVIKGHVLVAQGQSGRSAEIHCKSMLEFDKITCDYRLVLHPKI